MADPFGASPGGTADRSNDPIPPDADLPRPGTPGSQDWSTARAEFDAWVTQRDADRAASMGGAQEGEQACPKCGASLANPAHHERLSYCWRCGFGAGDGQEYPVEASRKATVLAKLGTVVGDPAALEADG